MDTNNLYQYGLYDFLENNEFHNLPAKALIDSDSRIALAVWKNYKNSNYVSHGYDDDYDSYNSYNKLQVEWNKILETYQANFNFWEKAELTQELLDERFQAQFPEVINYFLTDVSKIKELFEKSHNIQFIGYLENLISNDEFIKVKKECLLMSHVGIEDIQLFQDDKEFVLKVLNQRIDLYDYLNEENKCDTKIVNHVVNSGFYGFKSLSTELQLEHAKSFATKHSISPRELKCLDQEVINIILQNTHDINLISYFVTANPHCYQHEFISFLKNNPDSQQEVINKILREISITDGIILFKNNVEIVRSHLNNWIENMPIGPNTKFDNKIQKIIHSDKTLKEKLSSSMEYHFSLMWEKELKIKFDVLLDYFDNLSERVANNLISKEKMEANLRNAKSKMTVDDLKKYKIPNVGISNFLLYYKLNNEVVSEDSKNLNRKNKI